MELSTNVKRVTWNFNNLQFHQQRRKIHITKPSLSWVKVETKPTSTRLPVSSFAANERPAISRHRAISGFTCKKRSLLLVHQETEMCVKISLPRIYGGASHQHTLCSHICKNKFDRVYINNILAFTE